MKQPTRAMLHSRENIRAIYRAAIDVGHDVWNPEGGLTVDTPEPEILEVIFDVARGAEYMATIGDEPTEVMEKMAMTGFWKGVGDVSNR